MVNHFHEHLNVRQSLIEKRPSHVLEIGAGGGGNTRQLLVLQEELGYDLTVISDNILPWWEDTEDSIWIQAASQDVLKALDRGAADYAIVDTDHNYWTLDRELDELSRILGKGNAVAIHDTISFRDKNGINGTYDQGAKTWYPFAEISEETRPYAQAVDDWVRSGAYMEIRRSEESSGAVLLERRSNA